MMYGSLLRISYNIVPLILVSTQMISKNKIYVIMFMSTNYLDYFINRAAILQKNILLYHQYVAPNIFFDKVLAHLMTCQVSTPLLGTKYYSFLQFQQINGCCVQY